MLFVFLVTGVAVYFDDFGFFGFDSSSKESNETKINIYILEIHRCNNSVSIVFLCLKSKTTVELRDPLGVSTQNDFHNVSRMGLVHSVNLFRSTWLGDCNGVGSPIRLCLVGFLLLQ